MTETALIKSGLSEENIREIRQLYSDGTFAKDELVLIFDVDIMVINSVVLNRGPWRNNK